MSNYVILQQPVPALNALGATGNGRVTGTAALKLPTPKAVAQGTTSPALGVGLALPAPTLAARGDVAIVGNGVMASPTPALQAQGRVAQVGTVALVLPLPALRAANGNTIAFKLAAPTLLAHGAVGRVASAQLVLPALTLISAGNAPTHAGAALVAPTPTISVEGKVGNIGAMSAALRGIALAAHGATGAIGTCRLVLPVAGVLAATGFTPAVGAATLTLPMLLLYATGSGATVGSGASPDSAALPAFVMHTETGAITQYVNYAFNSFAAFGGTYLGANAEGLFVIATGDADNTTLINAAARVGITDFGTSFLKRIDRCYVGYRADGNITLRVYTDEVNVRDYMLEAYGKGGLHGNHSRIGKGLAARYWQFELISNGADFELNALELKPTHLRRRIGGGDA